MVLPFITSVAPKHKEPLQFDTIYLKKALEIYLLINRR